MTFNSWEFLLFYPIVLALYFILPKIAKWPMLLIASYFFYMCYSPELVFLIFGTTAISWISAGIIEAKKSAAIRRTALIITLLTSLGVLFFYKYFDFLSKSLFGIMDREPVLLNLLLPVGISFYTFQTLSYVIDVYRGDAKAEKNFLLYALFVSFFPQLVAGPIERPGNLISQLREPHKWSSENALAGAKLMILGFFKKICVADLISGAVDTVYSAPKDASSLAIVIATALFAVQIYCDFSGYTDIAIGSARIMGIRLMKNFDRPYRSESVKEFWGRWHISLSGWFRDYLYIPLGGSRCAKWRHLFNLFLVFFLSGLWHGAEWTFVIWGIVHAVYRIVGEITAKPRAKLISRLGLSEKKLPMCYARRILTLILVIAAWIPFRANNISDLGVLLTNLFTRFEGIGETFKLFGLSGVGAMLIAVSILLLWFMDGLVTYEGVGEGSAALSKNGAFIYFVWIILIVWTLLISNDMISAFIYFQF